MWSVQCKASCCLVHLMRVATSTPLLLLPSLLHSASSSSSSSAFLAASLSTHLARGFQKLYRSAFTWVRWWREGGGGGQALTLVSLKVGRGEAWRGLTCR
jgi:hypothetical protein